MQEYAQEFVKVWYRLPSQLAGKGGVYVLRAGQNLAKPGYRVGPRTIECHSIHFILEGELSLHYRDASAWLRGGDAFCLYPHKPYVYQRESDSSPLRMIWIAMGGEQVPDLVQLAGFREEEPYVRRKVGRQVRSAILKLVQTEPRTPKEDLLSQQLLYMLFRHLAGPPAARDTPFAAQPREDWLRECEEYMRLHYAEPIAIGDIAAKFGIHRSHFSSRFSREKGMSPKQYLSQLRMDKSNQLLGSTNLSITEIALTLGYSDLYAFTRAYTAYYGMSPSSYRSRLRGTPD